MSCSVSLLEEFRVLVLDLGCNVLFVVVWKLLEVKKLALRGILMPQRYHQLSPAQQS